MEKNSKMSREFRLKPWDCYDKALREWFTFEVVAKIPKRKRGKWSEDCGLDKRDKSGVRSYKNINGLRIDKKVQWKIEHLYKICKKLSLETGQEITPADILHKIERYL